MVMPTTLLHRILNTGDILSTDTTISITGGPTIVQNHGLIASDLGAAVASNRALTVVNHGTISGGAPTTGFGTASVVATLKLRACAAVENAPACAERIAVKPRPRIAVATMTSSNVKPRVWRGFTPDPTRGCPPLDPDQAEAWTLR